MPNAPRCPSWGNATPDNFLASHTILTWIEGNDDSHLSLLLFLIPFHQESLDAILLHPIALFQTMLMRSWNTITFPVPAITINSLDGIVTLPGSSRMRCSHGIIDYRQTKLRLHCWSTWLSRGKEVIALAWVWLYLATIRDEICSQHGTWEILGDLDLDIAEIAFSSCTLAFLLIWVI
jgi:hypothetical protein